MQVPTLLTQKKTWNKTGCWKKMIRNKIINLTFLGQTRLDYRNNLGTKTVIKTKLGKNVGTYFIDTKKLRTKSTVGTK